MILLLLLETSIEEKKNDNFETDFVALHTKRKLPNVFSSDSKI